MAKEMKSLGRGLAALIGEVGEEMGTLERKGYTPKSVPVEFLRANPRNPRKVFDDTDLSELTQSIKDRGIIQPIVVRPGEGGSYRIIAGERRWRAARRAGLTRVPVVVRDGSESDDKVLQLALIENIQRENLNPIDEATAYRRLVDEFRLTQEDIAAAVGKDRSSVANTLRLLRLPDEVRAEVATGRLSMGHARALLALPDAAAQRDLGRDIVARGLSVRETEALVKKALESASRPPVPARAVAEPDVHTRAAEEKLRLHLGTRVRIVRKGKKGRIEIDFVNEEELIRIFEALTE